ncbi:MAG TPA: YitT family protein [Gemmatimonadales bacterium]|nr:YitT family protein [Gemmatimonadales bacterium]
MEKSLAAPGAPPHSVLDDVQAFGTATVLLALGLTFLGSAGLLSGGVPGLAFLLRYGLGVPMGWALFLVNLPFCLLAWRALGPRFTVKTLVAMGCLSVAVEGVGRMLTFQSVQPLFAAVAGGLLIGVGLLVLFRHRASLGGIGVLALHMQRRRGWSPGAVQMAIDTAIVAASFAVVDWRRVAYSVVGALTVNAVLLWNHRPGRYGVPATDR